MKYQHAQVKIGFLVAFSQTDRLNLVLKLDLDKCIYMHVLNEVPSSNGSKI